MDNRKLVIIVIILFLICILVLGFIGGYITKSSDSKCDIGLTSLFCWEWHKIETKTYDTFDQEELQEP